MDIRSSIADTRKEFEKSFAAGDFYNRQTQDSEHLERILLSCALNAGSYRRVVNNIGIKWTMNPVPTVQKVD